MYEKYCKKIPIFKQVPSSGAPTPNATCPTGGQMGRMTCTEMSILELWMDDEGNYDEAAINSLSTIEEVVCDSITFINWEDMR